MTKPAAYDYIVVGSGAAGAIIASRLARCSNAEVLLVERGPAANSILLKMPAGMTTVLKSGRYSRTLPCEPNPSLGGRTIPLFEGAVLGGSTSVNGLAYVRGHPGDYDDWAAQGCAGWGYDQMLDHFRRCERHPQRTDHYHGQDGPVTVCFTETPGPLAAAFLRAGAEAGYPCTQDSNGVQQGGFGPGDRMVAKGRRVSPATAYLKPAMARRNLTILTGAAVQGVVFQGDRAIE